MRISGRSVESVEEGRAGRREPPGRYVGVWQRHRQAGREEAAVASMIVN